ncbi:hypothetical protein [Paraburkholderia azotifigens]|uniref:Uncharacterized protein n=1 Tax=Paraburkholderia azotifigens TaxID=2057004 RepID=A0A5C6V3G2_9BURK|nr:hypothetical protein [Paraburkholderia azotifigens]TXC79096.1 hypothetical protein FRZ40_32235 [Paraburkholderia azotifigens]
MHIPSTDVGTLLDNLDVDLLAAIQAHMEERGSSSSAYVVPMTSIFIVRERTEERCAFIAVPQTSRNDVDIGFKRIFSEVRVTPDRKQRACLMLADGAVALAEAAVVGVDPLQYKRLAIIWMFADEIAISEYSYSNATSEALLRASRVADAHARSEQRGTGLRSTGKQTIVEVFDIFDVDGRIPS